MADDYFSATTADPDIREMREAFEYAWNEGADNRRERQLDLKYLAGDPWPEDDKQNRSLPGAERPCLVFDELNQYTNLVVNSQMQARLGIAIEPEGDGSNDETARLEADTIRGIEYRSKAQQSYMSGFEGAVWGGFGGWRVGKKFLPGTWDQDLQILPIHNQETYIIDGCSVDVDGSDQKDSWIINRIGRKKFEAKYGKEARFTNFTPEQIDVAPQWFGADDIQIAEYWKKRTKRRKLIDVKFATGQRAEGFLDDLKAKGFGVEGKQVYYAATRQLVGQIMRDRWDEIPIVTSQITNGIEILEENEWPGQWIPLVPCYGKIMWVDYGAGPKRVLLSLIRLARDPQMALNYCKTAIVETIGQMPKGGVVGYEGQFENQEQEWASSTKIPKTFLQVKATIEALPNQLLPLPTNRAFSADIAAAQSAAEDYRRSIQAAVGQNALPSSAQTRSEKSGVALSRIAEAQAIGSYHFVQHFEASVAMTGRIIEDLLDSTYDTERTLGLRGRDESYKMQVVPAGSFKAKHATTVTTGPSSQSQREAVEKVAGDLMQNQQFAPRVAWLAIKLLNLGPLGDQISDLLKPPDIASAEGMNPQQIQQQIMQQQQQLAQAQQLIAKLDEELKKEQEEKAGRVLENQTKFAIAEKQDATERFKALLESKTKLTLEAVKSRLSIDEIEAQKDADIEVTEVEHQHASEMNERNAEIAEDQAKQESKSE